MFLRECFLCHSSTGLYVDGDMCSEDICFADCLYRPQMSHSCSELPCYNMLEIVHFYYYLHQINIANTGDDVLILFSVIPSV